MPLYQRERETLPRAQRHIRRTTPRSMPAAAEAFFPLPGQQKAAVLQNLEEGAGTCRQM
jgi:hypothetical protein